MSSQDEPTADRTDGDNWLTGAEAARILGVSRRKIFRMVDRGELQTRGRYLHRNFRRATVEAALNRGQAISLAQAARILGRSPSFVRELIAAGELTSFANPKWPVFRLEVEQYARAHPAPPQGSPPPDRIGQLTTKGASQVLGVSVDRVKQLARAGLIPSDKDERGRYWFRSEHLAMYVRARNAEAAAERFRSLPAAPNLRDTTDLP